MRSARKLTEVEQNRMRNMCASGPLNYKSGIDDELIALHLAEMWDNTEDAVDYTGTPFYAENGTILDCWLTNTLVKSTEYIPQVLEGNYEEVDGHD